MRLTIVLTLAAAAVALTACAQSASASDPAAIIQNNCTRCHPIERIKAANHDLAGWQNTVSRMMSRGAGLTPQEAAAIEKFLANGGGSQL